MKYTKMSINVLYFIKYLNRCDRYKMGEYFRQDFYPGWKMRVYVDPEKIGTHLDN